MEKDMFKFKVGGRTLEQTFTNAMTLLKYIDKLQPNKMYGIMKAGTSITLLTKNEVIPTSLVKEKIEELKNLLKTCNKKTDIDRIKAINERILELQELLGEE